MFIFCVLLSHVQLGNDGNQKHLYTKNGQSFLPYPLYLEADWNIQDVYFMLQLAPPLHPDGVAWRQAPQLSLLSKNAVSGRSQLNLLYLILGYFPGHL